MNNQIGKGSRDRVKNLNEFRQNYDEIFKREKKYLCQDCNIVKIEDNSDGAICQDCWEKELKYWKLQYDWENGHY